MSDNENGDAANMLRPSQAIGIFSEMPHRVLFICIYRTRARKKVAFDCRVHPAGGACTEPDRASPDERLMKHE
jgi:hypothetical protein